MKEISNDFSIEVHSINEEQYYALGPIDAVKKISYEKGIEISKKNVNDVVISADTIVVLNNKIIGKPENKDDAIKILKTLSGKAHKVITGYSIFYNNKYVTDIVITDVVFNKLDNNLITTYVDSGSPLDKAGAYGIQDNNKFPIIEKIIGSYDNVVGFPIKEIKDSIKRLIQ